ncbi:hypothetical protein OAL05_00685 [bacterium]|nr:hypothetical protein [bacterium]
MKELIDLTAVQLRKLKLLEDKNKRLKLLVADLSLDKQIRQDVLSKKPLRLLAIEKRQQEYCSVAQFVSVSSARH